MKFTLLKRGQRKVPDDIIKKKRPAMPMAPWKRRGTWEEADDNDTTYGHDALSQALQDTGWDNDSSPW